MKAFKTIVQLHVKNDLPTEDQRLEVHLPNCDAAIEAADLNAAMAEKILGRLITTTKLEQTYDRTKLSMEFRFADNGEMYMTVEGETVEVEGDSVPKPVMTDKLKSTVDETRKEILAQLEKEEARQLAEHLAVNPIPKNLIN